MRSNEQSESLRMETIYASFVANNAHLGGTQGEASSSKVPAVLVTGTSPARSKSRQSSSDVPVRSRTPDCMSY